MQIKKKKQFGCHDPDPKYEYQSTIEYTLSKVRLKYVVQKYVSYGAIEQLQFDKVKEKA